MPTSSKAGKSWTVNWVKTNKEKIKRVLDLGCGEGTYANYIKKKNNLLLNSIWVGIEIHSPYIEKYKLNEKYDKIINYDIRQLNFDELGEFDLCFLGDVLEHMTKEESIAVVKNVLDYCKRIIISIPVVYFPGAPHEDNPYEAHIKDDWSDLEVKESFPCILDSYREKAIGVYLLGKREF